MNSRERLYARREHALRLPGLRLSQSHQSFSHFLRMKHRLQVYILRQPSHGLKRCSSKEQKCRLYSSLTLHILSQGRARKIWQRRKLSVLNRKSGPDRMTVFAISLRSILALEGWKARQVRRRIFPHLNSTMLKGITTSLLKGRADIHKAERL